MTYFLDPEQRCVLSRLGPAPAGPVLLTTGTAYFTYLGYSIVPLTPKYVECYCEVIGAGAQTAELGLFSSPLAPNKAGQALTKVVATGAIGALGVAGVIRNTAAFAVVVPAGTHLWAGMRTAMAVTQPTMSSLGGDMQEGFVLTAAGAGVLTGAGPWAGLVVAAAIAATGVAPDLRLTLD